jgi:hypothetical protein
VKLGVNINGDIIKLAADYGAQVQIASCLHTVQIEIQASGGLSELCTQVPRWSTEPA